MMFSSTEGGGALAFAIATATLLLCQNKTANDACGICDNCKKAAHGVHPDIKFFFPSEAQPDSETEYNNENLAIFRAAISQNPYMSATDWKNYLLRELEAKNKQLLIYKSQITQIHREARLKPMLAPWNVIIIWLPELFHHAAIPKLLKILEEPPDDTLFILATEDQVNILPTILSRVQIFRVPPVNEVNLLEFLFNTLPEDKRDFKKLGEIVNICDGNVSMALRLIGEEETTVFFPLFQNWMRASYSFNVPEIFQVIQQLEKYPREQQKNFFLFSLHVFREACNRKKGHTHISKTQPHEAVWLKKFEPALDDSMLYSVRQRLEKALYYLERNAATRLVLLNLSLDIGKEFKEAARRLKTPV
ncbi:MAG: hypothetical protein NZM15_08405 [Flavobacteriales bacterium]|nr:hypothetical protein [Flavobacteriales bacterium]MDW8432707.1 hypothetical protein [Flavobacteriales bacterium]